MFTRLFLPAIFSAIWKAMKTMTDIKLAYAAYSNGYDAFFNAEKFTYNPYNKKMNKEAWKNWRNGWKAADTSGSEDRFHEWK